MKKVISEEFFLTSYTTGEGRFSTLDNPLGLNTYSITLDGRKGSSIDLKNVTDVPLFNMLVNATVSPRKRIKVKLRFEEIEI